MDILHGMIWEMSKDEIRYFKIYATRMTKAEGRKDLQLFDFIRKGKGHYDERKVMQTISGSNRNSFYRLKNRLAGDIEDFFALHYFDAGPLHQLNHQWALFHVYLEKRQFEIAWFFLKKAEKKALAFENFDMLDIIYTHLVRLTKQFPSVDPEYYIKLQKENTKRLNLLREMDQTIAVLSRRLQITQNWSSEDASLTRMLDKTIREFSRNAKMTKGQVFQTRLFNAVSQVLIQRHKYRELAAFVSKRYRSFSQKNWFSKENHELKLQMLTYLANSFYSLQKFQESLQYTTILGQELDAFKQ